MLSPMFSAKKAPVLYAANRQAVTAHIRPGCTSRASTMPEAGTEVWGLPPAAPSQAKISIHVIHGSPPSMTEIKPLQLDELQPANMTKPVLLEFLQSQLKARAAAQKGIHGVVLSAALLPSQLDTLKQLASHLELTGFCLIGSSNLHMLLLRLPVLGWSSGSPDQQQQQQQSASHGMPNRTHMPPTAVALLIQLLEATFSEGLQQLPSERLAAARAAEQTLVRQLRLWDAATWAETLQQLLLSKKAVRPLLAIRSLMGPPALEAAKKLVEKQGLYLVELKVELQVSACTAAGAGSDGASGATSSTASASRRRPRGGNMPGSEAGTTGSTAAGVASSTSGCSTSCGSEVVLVISRWLMSAEQLQIRQLPQELFTDFVYTAHAATAGGSSSGAAGGSAAAGAGDAGNKWMAQLVAWALNKQM